MRTLASPAGSTVSPIVQNPKEEADSGYSDEEGRDLLAKVDLSLGAENEQDGH